MPPETAITAMPDLRFISLAPCEGPTGTAYDKRLSAAEPEDFAAHGDHAWKGELESQREQQKHHADLRDRLRLRAIGQHRERERPKNDADDQVAQDRRHADAPCQRQHQHRGEQEYQDLAERLYRHTVTLRRVRVSCPLPP